jgi:hypothetical protein
MYTLESTEVPAWLIENPDDDSDDATYRIVVAPTPEIAAIKSGWSKPKVYRLGILPVEGGSEMLWPADSGEDSVIAEFDL